MLTRRGLLVSGAAVASVYGGGTLIRRAIEPSLTFEAMPGLPGFRRLVTSEVSAGQPLALLDVSDDPAGAPGTTIDCAALFGPERPEDTVPLAYFSDARCIFCRTLSPALKEIETEGGVDVTWHELPLLGSASQVAARASLAAGLQGAYAAFHARLMGTPFLPNDAYLRRLAADQGIDGDRLLHDMNSARVAQRLNQSAMLARQLGFYGTPGFVIGRTVILGNLTTRQLHRILVMERAEPVPYPCR
ncbi:protein-disulfide isomerase [Roseovarius sp. MBR-51]